jgi:hypothetical protein
VCDQYKTIAAPGMEQERIGSYSYTRQKASERGLDFYPAVAARIMARYSPVVVADPAAHP